MHDKSLLYHFLNANEDNFIKIAVSGKQKQEAWTGLSCTVKFICEKSSRYDYTGLYYNENNLYRIYPVC